LGPQPMCRKVWSWVMGNAFVGYKSRRWRDGKYAQKTLMSLAPLIRSGLSST